MHRSPGYQFRRSSRLGAGATLLGVVLSAAACSVPTSAGGPGTTFTSFETDVIKAVLTYEERCGLLDPSREAQQTELLDLNYPSYLTMARDAAAQGGFVSYSSSCIVNGLKASSCSANGFANVSTACANQISTGTVAVGLVCTLNDECNKGYCKGLNGALCGSGICTALAMPGGACPTGVECDESLGYCSSGTCQPRLPGGAQCASTADCLSGLYCIKANSADATGACSAQQVGKSGAACNLDPSAGQTCGAGLSCYLNAMSNYVCQPIVQQGGVCPSSDACAGTLTCAKQSDAAATGICQPLGAPNATCAIDTTLGQQCQNTLTCFAAAANAQAFCTPQPDIGGSCSATLSCLIGQCSSASTCQPKTGAGLACTQASDCASNMCVSNLCLSPSC